MARAKPPLSAAGRVHDMGGQPGGRVPIDLQGQPVFAQNWQARALAVTVAAGGLGKWTLDESRHARERLPAEDYMAYGYYEKWMAGLATLLVEHGLVTMDELRSGQLAAGGRQRAGQHDPLPLTAAQVRGALARGGPSRRPDRTPPRYACGQKVHVLSPESAARQPGGHTRLPSYAAYQTGVIISHHGTHVLPDSNAHGLGETPEHLYGVCFCATELWPGQVGSTDEVCLDLWESYLVALDE